MKKILSFFVLFFPWRLKRFFLINIWKYEIHPKAKIGLSYIYPEHLIMEEGTHIGHFNIGIHLNKIVLKKNSNISRNNWITGYPIGKGSKHFSHDTERVCELILGQESAITKNHHLDCTNYIHIGDFVTIAGYSSQFLTHSIDIYQSRQDSHPIIIGDYSFISTGVKILGGSSLPAYSVLGAGAVLNKSYTEEWKIYGGVPAKPIKDIPKSAKYFSRNKGFIY